MAYNIYQLS